MHGDHVTLVFGVTDEDISELTPEEFTVVWEALGKVSWARGQALRRQRDLARERAKEQG